MLQIDVDFEHLNISRDVIESFEDYAPKIIKLDDTFKDSVQDGKFFITLKY